MHAEETCLWKYFAESPDCFSLRCRKFVTLEKALVVSCPPRLSRPTWSANNVPLQDLCAAAGMPAPEICNQLHVSQQDLEAFLQAPICVQLHALFMLLMRQQGWSTLMCRVSWMPGPRVGRHKCEQHSMFLPTEAFRAVQAARVAKNLAALQANGYRKAARISMDRASG